MKRVALIELVRAKLTAWWKRHKRDMPWRRSRDPYAIWVSEIMLQQTRVATVMEYYPPFLSRFPNVHSLADAPLDDVLKAWEGMGYYGRARNLHRAAKQIAADLDGKLPRTVPQLRRLPGIGAYTAGAIASIAFGLDEPVVDGNVIRVLCRVFALRGDPGRTPVKKKLWALATALIPPGQAGLFNQALMDLGATLCSPKQPRCAVCCLRNGCRALASGRPERLPTKTPRKPTPHYDIVAGVIWKRGRVLIDRRPPEGLLGGLWEFPGGKIEPGESPEVALRREIREEMGIEVEVGRRLAKIDHAYTHFRITLHVFSCRHTSGRVRPAASTAWKWVLPRNLARYPFPRANQKVVEQLQPA